MCEKEKLPNIKNDNRGASLILVLAVFVVMLVVVMNLLLLVSSGNYSTKQEYEKEQTDLYLTSIYEILNTQMEEGIWKDAFVMGQTTTIDVTGFEDAEGNAIPVEIKVSLDKTLADVEYNVTYGGEQYQIAAKYSCRKKEGELKIVLRYCEEVRHLSE